MKSECRTIRTKNISNNYLELIGVNCPKEYYRIRIPITNSCKHGRIFDRNLYLALDI